MIGHRSAECKRLVWDIMPKLRQVFRTEGRVFFQASSGTGLLEAAVRNCVDKKALHCINGAFSQRWYEISQANGKACDSIEVPWGEAIKPEMVSEKLASGEYDTVAFTHNETSTGVTSPIKALAEAVRQGANGDEIVIMVDSVSGMAGARLETDDWDVDVVVSASQKAFALPAGLAFCSVSERAMKRAAGVPNRGYYFDFLELDRYFVKYQTPSTPAISLLFALDQQLDVILAEGYDQRMARHLAMRDRTISWAKSQGFSLFAEAGYESPTLTCVSNDPGIDVAGLNQYLKELGMTLSNGYGSQLKEKTFRIAHMGQLQMADLEALFAAIEGYMAGA